MPNLLCENHEHTNRCWWDVGQARWVCAPSPSDVVPTDQPLVDVRDMVVVHTALLREFRLAPMAVRRSDAGDVRRAGVVARHLTFLCDLLHHHHAGEDELLWPKLRTRLQACAVATMDAVDAQHTGLDAALGATRTLLASWAADAGVAHRDALAAQLDAVHALLREHLELEERVLLPLAAALLTPQEWHAVGEAAVASTPKTQLLLSFGMFAYEGDPAVVRDMLATAPPPVRVLLPRVARRVYAHRARAVHGTGRP